MCVIPLPFRVRHLPEWELPSLFAGPDTCQNVRNCSVTLALDQGKCVPRPFWQKLGSRNGVELTSECRCKVGVRLECRFQQKWPFKAENVEG